MDPHKTGESNRNEKPDRLVFSPSQARGFHALPKAAAKKSGAKQKKRPQLQPRLHTQLFRSTTPPIPAISPGIPDYSNCSFVGRLKDRSKKELQLRRLAATILLHLRFTGHGRMKAVWSGRQTLTEDMYPTGKSGDSEAQDAERSKKNRLKTTGRPHHTSKKTQNCRAAAVLILCRPVCCCLS